MTVIIIDIIKYKKYLIFLASDSEFYRKFLSVFFKDFNNLTKRKLHFLNNFLSYTYKDNTVIEMAYPKVIETLAIIDSDLKKHRFKWLNLELNLIDNLIEILNIFMNPSSSDLDPHLLFFLDTRTLEALFPLSFIDDISSYPDNNYGKPIYEKTKDFFTKLLNFFINFYLRKDFFFLERIEIEEIDTLTPFGRQRIREKNQNNVFIQDKYFKPHFNLIEFVIKIVNKFIIGLSQRWISDTQRVHFYGVEMSKMLVEYSLLSGNDCERVKNILYQKIQNLKLLEDIIDHEPKEFPVESITQDFIKIREFYGEFLLNLAYIQQDLELISFFENVYKAVDLKLINKSNYLFQNWEGNKNVEKFLPFENNFFFEKEYSRKSIEIFGYSIHMRLNKHTY